MNQPGIPDIQMADNPSERLPLAIVLDGSGSMSGAAIDALNAGLKALEEELKNDPVARLRVQLCLIRIGGNDEVELVTDWTDAINFTAPTIAANGTTPLGKGVEFAAIKIEDQKQKYKAAGVKYKRPWLYLITDGEPTDSGWQQAATACKQAAAAKKVVVFAVLTGAAKAETMKQFTDTVMNLQGIKFKELFVWLSASASAGSKAQADSQVQVQVPHNVLNIPT